MKSHRFSIGRRPGRTTRGFLHRSAVAVRPLVELLESRRLLAADVTIIAGAAGSGTVDHFLSVSNGTLPTSDDSGDTGATLSTGALIAVGSSVPISINATNQIIFQDVGSLTLKTGSAFIASFNTTSGSISFNNIADTISTGGGSLSFSAGTGLTVANLNADGGNVFLTAGAGSSGTLVVNQVTATTADLTSFGGSIDSAGSAPVGATGELAMSAADGITVNTSAAKLSAVNSTSGFIEVTQVASPALALATAGNGVVNDASSGIDDVTNLGSTLTVASGAPVTTVNGGITLAATDLTISGAVSSGSAKTTLANSVAGAPINLGTANVSGTIGITQTYLNNVTAAAVQIGTPSAGPITISQPISGGTLTLINNSTITETSSPGVGTLSATNLTIESTGPVALNNTTVATTLTIDATNSITVNQVNATTANLSSFSGSISSAAANSIGATGELTLDAADGITVNTTAALLEATNSTSGNVSITQVASPALALDTTGTGIVNDASDGTTNVTNLGNTFTVASGAPVTTDDGSITLLATNLAIIGAVSSGSASTTLGNSIAGEPMNLGTSPIIGTVGLTQSYLNNVTAAFVRVGTPTAGPMTISQAITETSLSLINNGVIVESTSPGIGSLTVTTLRVSSTGPVALSNTNEVSNLAASTSNSFLITNGSDSLNVPTSGADGVQGIATSNSAITLTSSSGGITALASISAGSGAVNATAAGSITVDQVQGLNVTLTSSTGSIDSAAANPIQATDELAMSAATGITVNSSAASLKASNSTSGSIEITQAASPAQSLTTAGTGVTNNASTGVIDVTNLGSSITVASGSPVKSVNGNVTLAATDFTISAAVSSGSARTVLGNSVAGAPMNLGVAGVTGTVGLTQTSLNNVTAGVVQVGTPSAGAITISEAITYGSLTVSNNGSITESSVGSLTITNLRISSAGPVALSNANEVINLASSTSGAFLIENGTDSLNLPNAGIDGVQGVATNNAAITLGTADGNITINAPINAGTGTVSLTAGGAISDGASADSTTSSALAVTANDGVNLDTVVTNLAFDNTFGSVVIRNTGALTINSVAGLTTSSDGGPTTLNANTLITFAVNATSGGALAANDSVKILSGAILKILAPSSITGLLTVQGSGQLDVTNASMVINYGVNPDPSSTLVSYLTSGYAAGAWTGAGIISSSVAASNTSQSKLIYSVGYADGADGIVKGLTTTQFEILPTLAGDAQLAGNVVFGDFQLLAASFGKTGGWDKGNFTYGSLVTFGDFQLLAQNFGQTSAQLAGADSSSSPGSFASAAKTTAVAPPATQSSEIDSSSNDDDSFDSILTGTFAGLAQFSDVSLNLAGS